LLRQGGADVKQQASNPSAKETPPQRVVVAPPAGNTSSPEPRKRDEEMTLGNAQSKKSVPPDFQASTTGWRQARGAGATRQARQVAAAPEPRVVNARHESPAPTLVEKQAAKEQLVYALRLASAKLNEVRKMTRGEESPRHSFNERDRIR
jgi:hypothetical protein